MPLTFSQGCSSIVEDFALEDQGSKTGFYQAWGKGGLRDLELSLIS